MGRPMFHLEVKVYEDGSLIKGFSTPRRFQDIVWADYYFRYLRFLAGKFYPIFKRWCAGDGSLPGEDYVMNLNWFIYHCPIYLKRNLKIAEADMIYEMCRVQYYQDNPTATELKVELNMVQKRADY